MPGLLRAYRLRVAERGAELVDDSTTEFTIDAGSANEDSRLFRAPIATSQSVYPLQGRTDMRPFTVEGIDTDGSLTTDFSVSGRWAAIGRLCDVQYREIDASGSPVSAWVTYGLGRVAQLDQADGPGKYRIEIADESWKSRAPARLFQRSDTTQLWPAGVRAYWRGFPAARPAVGDAFEITSDTFYIQLSGFTFDARSGTTHHDSVFITRALLSWIESDLVPEAERVTVTAGTGGNFNHLRLNFGGNDYEIITFAQQQSGPILQSLEDPRVGNDHFGSTGIVIWAWCYIGSSPSPPATGDAWLWAPDAEPSEDIPLHVGLVDTTHEWGTDAGFIHVADMTRRYCEHFGLIYDTVSFDAIEADLSFPALSPRVTESPADPEQWMQDHIWGFCQVALLRDVDGKRKLVDLRPPREVDEYLPVLDASNAKDVRWQLSGREAINAVRWWYLKISLPPPRKITLADWVLKGGADEDPATDTKLDGFRVSDEYTDPLNGTEAQLDSGVRLHTYDARAAGRVGYNDTGLFGSLLGKLQVIQRMLSSGAGSPMETVEAFLGPATLSTYQDGLIRLRGEVRGDVADVLEEGDLIYVDLDALGIPSPGLFGPELPGSVGPLQPGEGHGALVTGPALGALVLNANLTITVPVSSIPVGQTAVVEYAVNDSESDPPSSSSQAWLEAGTRTATGNVTTPVQQRGTYVWIRVSGEVDDIRVSAFSTPVVVEIPDEARFVGAAISEDDGNGQFAVTWEPNSLGVGVMVCWSIHLPGVSDTTPECQSVYAADLFFEIPDLVPFGYVIDVTLTAWSNWSSDSVDGTEGATVALSRSRANGVRLNDLVDVDVDSPDDADVLTYDSSSDTWGPAPAGGAHNLDSHTDVIITAAASGEVLTYNGAAWVDAAPVLVTHTLDDHSDVNTAAAINGDVLTRVAGVWMGATAGGGTLDGLSDVDLDSLEDGDLLQWIETPGTWKNAKPEIYYGNDFPQYVWGGRLAFRTDRGILYFYDSNNARWLSVQTFVQPLTTSTAAITAGGSYYWPNPWAGEWDIYATVLRQTTWASNTTATNYFVGQLAKGDDATSTNVGSSISGQSITQNQWVKQEVTVNAVIASTVESLTYTVTETGTASSWVLASLHYRLVG